MTTCTEDFEAPAAEAAGWTRTERDVLESDETDEVTNDHRHHNRAGQTSLLDQTLLKLLNEVVAGIPALTGIQALRVWLHRPEGGSIRLNLLLDGLPARLRAGTELPVDDSVANWVLQNQRPLFIAAEMEASFPDFARLLQESGVEYFSAVPLMLAGRLIGVLELASTRRMALENFDLKFVQRSVANLTNGIKKDCALPLLSRTNGHSQGEGACSGEDLPAGDNFEGIIGRSAAIRALTKQIKVVAPTGSTVLILGETGAGKELIARAIHNLSPRRNRPFIKVNCAAIPAGLIESELFGHERGAFTGAVGQRIGRFEMANGGTLFLDEIGDIPVELQPKLLRVLQEQEFERIGGTQTLRVNVRIVAATSRNLPEMVAAREFRIDLYYRLNVFPLSVPPLRERLEDIPLLVRHFVDLYARRMEKCITTIPPEAMEVLSRYAWPGNVRELQNVIERAVILSPGQVLRPPLAELKAPADESLVPNQGDSSNNTTLEGIQRRHIIQALAETNWVIGGPKGAAARLGLQRTTLRAKMQRLGIFRCLA